MKTIILKIMILIFAGSTTSTIAAINSTEQAGDGILLWFLIGFGVMVLLFQLVPAMAIFCSMVNRFFFNKASEAPLTAQKGKSNK
ncbi:MAG: hypothetical protein PHH91_03135 [Desulfuromonadaceae bacterium]|nr:hypothetical protein [Desulfuromonadaceae bacterium]